MKFCKLGSQSCSSLQQWPDNCRNERMVYDELTDAIFKFNLANHANLEPEIA